MAVATDCPPIDIEALLRPIHEDRPAGDADAYTRTLRPQFSELRNPPRSSNPDDPDGAQGGIDWAAITRLAVDALQSTTKDLRVACHLLEAAMQQWGIAGLRDGLRLLRRMSETYWETLAPELDPDDPETRVSPLENLLDDPIHGPRLPTALRSLPLIDSGTRSFSLTDAMRPGGDVTAADVEAAMRQVPAAAAQQLRRELDEALAELAALQELLIERLHDYAPLFPHLQESLQLVRQWFDTALPPQQESERPTETACDAGRPPAAADAAAAVSKTDGRNPEQLLDQSLQLRRDAYRQLTEAADVLQRLEPHSPIPYMVHRVVQLGQLPFPKLMSRMVKEESTLEMFSRELGLPGSELDGSRDDD